ncbi:MAG: 3-deoxy-7-phosphoheptulonate synthase [Acidobacteria bacterium]|nr:3-deoxy-7-phosphoheptulonate synthase [Acidobacteriota bacterium]
MKNIKLAARESRPPTVVNAGGVEIGSGFSVIAGPCAVETEEQTVTTARAVQAAGADVLRGGAFKPRTSPYAFQGLGIEGLKILAVAGAETGLPIITEVLDPRDVSWIAEYADILQIGTRNMQNFALLKEVGRADKPVMLKRGMYSTLEEWLNCAEYILGEGNPDVILCERGIRSFEQYTRNTLDLAAVPALRELTHLPVIVDPTHATGRPSLVGPMSMGALAVGAAGIMVEVHCNPAEALCDARQALTMDAFASLMGRLRGLETYLAAQASESEVTG